MLKADHLCKSYQTGRTGNEAKESSDAAQKDKKIERVLEHIQQYLED